MSLFCCVEFPCLSSLSLEGTSVTDVGIQELFQNGGATELLYLDLSRTMGITHAVLQYIHTKLKALHLEGCQVGSCTLFQYI